MLRKQQRALQRRQKEQQQKRLRSAQQIQRDLEEIENKQRELEAQGVIIEQALRQKPDDNIQGWDSSYIYKKLYNKLVMLNLI